MLNGLLESVSSLVFPPKCEICDVAVAPSAGVCAECASDIQWLKPPFCVSCGRSLSHELEKCGPCTTESFHYDCAYASALYDGKNKELIHAYKFKRRKHLKIFFAKSLIRFARLYLRNERFDAVVAVPLDPIKKMERGFNQSELLAAQVSIEFHIPDASKGLERKKSPSPQSLLNKTDRKTNVKDRFFTKTPSFFNQKKILLIDDILTTGQTASECARTLKNAGASRATVLVCARGLYQ